MLGDPVRARRNGWAGVEPEHCGILKQLTRTLRAARAVSPLQDGNGYVTER